MLKIKELRIEKGLYQKDLAEALNTTITTICDYERGRTQPSVEGLIKLANVLEVTTDELIGRANNLGNVVINGERLTTEEAELVRIYRNLGNDNKEQLVTFGKYLETR